MSKKPSGPFAGLKELRDKLAAEEKARAEKGQKPAPAPRPPPARSKPKSAEAASEEDALAFHRLVSGVTPLDQRQAQRVTRSIGAAAAGSGLDRKAIQQRAREAAAAEADDVHEHLRALVEGGTRFEVADDGRRVEGRRIDVPPEWLRKLRRGLLPVDGKLDLHGLRAEEARAALATFLDEKRERGERCVLVVHGKGEHSPGGYGVLRGEIAAWLSQGPASVNVAAFATARDDDGGEGAVYVLLRR